VLRLDILKKKGGTEIATWALLHKNKSRQIAITGHSLENILLDFGSSYATRMVSSVTLSALLFALALATPLTWAEPPYDNFEEQGKRFRNITTIKYGTRDSKIKAKNSFEARVHK
jgi:hypothetical protein